MAAKRADKKPDVELVDPSGELLTIYLDVTLPALHQEAITSREQVYDLARKAKAEAYPRKDSSGRLVNESFCVPFILTSMGGLCREGHDFLRLCKKRNKTATLRLLDVLATQHAKWTARRIRRSLFGQSLVDFSGSSWSCIKLHSSTSDPKPINRRKKAVSRMMQEFSQADQEKRCHACSSNNENASAQLTEVPEQAQHQSFIPGMSAYDSQDASVDVGTAKCIGNLSFSTKSAHCEEYTIFSQTSDVESDAFSVFG